MSLPAFNVVNEGLMAALYALHLTGARALGSRRRVGWLFAVGANLAGITLNAVLGLYTGVAFGVVSLALSVRGYVKWGDAPQEKK